MSEEKAAPAIGVSLSVAPSDGRSLVFQTHVPQDISKADMDLLVDKLYATAERVVNRCAAQSLSIVIEKLQDEHEDQCVRASEESAKIDGLRAEIERSSGDRVRTKGLASQVIALEDQLRQHAINEASYNRIYERQVKKMKAHLDKAK